ncbi:hypothetical protein SEA_XKCD426_62 [Streptomyces phage Xkcd426]|nr:hypothetical protein SEA_XKCD426_62 [Streptomyces phage Xkcd426]
MLAAETCDADLPALFVLMGGITLIVLIISVATIVCARINR